MSQRRELGWPVQIRVQLWKALTSFFSQRIFNLWNTKNGVSFKTTKTFPIIKIIGLTNFRFFWAAINALLHLLLIDVITFRKESHKSLISFSQTNLTYNYINYFAPDLISFLRVYKLTVSLWYTTSFVEFKLNESLLTGCSRSCQKPISLGYKVVNGPC